MRHFHYFPSRRAVPPGEAPARPSWCGECGQAWPCPGAYAEEADARAMLRHTLVSLLNTLDRHDGDPPAQQGEASDLRRLARTLTGTLPLGGQESPRPPAAPPPDSGPLRPRLVTLRDALVWTYGYHPAREVLVAALRREVDRLAAEAAARKE